MTAPPRVPLSGLVIQGKGPVAPSSAELVWNLNLDQIEANTGRVLAKEMVAPDELGPSTYFFEHGTLLYSKLRPYLNKVVVADAPGYATTELVPLRCNAEAVCSQYLAHFLRSPEFLQFANTVVAGAKMPRMVMSEFWRYEIPLPPLSEQRRIAAILDQADALRAKRREALTQLDRLTQAIFVEMFGDPTTNPLGWPRVNLGELIDEGPQNGLYKPSTDYGSGIPILRIDGFYDGVVTNLNALRRVRLSPEEVQLFGLRANDIVINRVNSLEYLGKSALIPELSEPTVFESNMMRLRMKSSVINPVYMVAFMQSGYVKSQILTCAKNAVNQSSINQQDVKGFSINVPPLSLQKTFDDHAQAIKSIHARQQSGLTDLDALFTSLQHRAFAGEL